MLALFIALLPVYLFGNLHCMGMCGPLVMMLGRHRFRYFYFLGRLSSFTLAGLLAGEAGAVMNTALSRYQVASSASFLFGGIILATSVSSLLGKTYPGQKWLGKRMRGVNHSLSLLMLKDKPLATFLFGFFTVALPCGQTLIVFSACALTGSAWAGFVNGFAFALFTSPSLFLAMQAHTLFKSMTSHYQAILGSCGIIIGGLSLLRGLAEIGVIAHWVLNPHSPYHIVIF